MGYFHYLKCFFKKIFLAQRKHTYQICILQWKKLSRKVSTTCPLYLIIWKDILLFFLFCSLFDLSSTTTLKLLQGVSSRWKVYILKGLFMEKSEIVQNPTDPSCTPCTAIAYGKLDLIVFYIEQYKPFFPTYLGNVVQLW